MVALHPHYGFPIVTANNVFDVVSGLGITPWPLEAIRDLEDYRRGDLTEKDRGELRFAPITQVLTLATPDGSPYHGFRTVGRDWASVFALLTGDLVPAVAEYKHGAHAVTLALPSGVVSRTDQAADNPLLAAGQREFLEETGIELTDIKPLGRYPMAVSGRQSTQCFLPCLGDIDPTAQPSGQKLDRHEHLTVVLFPLEEWLTAMETLPGIEASAVATTYLALRRLGHF